MRQDLINENAQNFCYQRRAYNSEMQAVFNAECANDKTPIVPDFNILFICRVISMF